MIYANQRQRRAPVSYTHLDVYKRQVDSGVIAYIDNYNNAMKTGNRFSLDILSVFAIKSSTELNCSNNFNPVFSPTPGIPGI